MRCLPSAARRWGAAVAVLVLGAVGCTGGSSGSAPFDAQRAEVDGVAFLVPAAWQTSEPDAQLIPARLVEYVERVAEPDEIPPQVGLVRAAGDGERASLDGFIEVAYQLNALTSQQAIEVVADDPVEVDGAVAARRLRMAVQDPRATEPVQLASLVVEFPDRVVYDLRYVATTDEFDEEFATTILDSFEAEPAAWEAFQRDADDAAGT